MLEKVSQETQELENLVGLRQYGGEVFAWGLTDLTDLTVFVSSGKELRQLSVFSKTFGLPKHVKDENGSNPTGRDTFSLSWSFLVKTDLTSTEYFSEYFTEFKTWGFQNAGVCTCTHCTHCSHCTSQGIGCQWDSVRSNCRATFDSSFPQIRSVRMGRFGAAVDTVTLHYFFLFLLQPQPVNISEPDPLRMTESGLNHGYTLYPLPSTAIHRPRSWSPALCRCCQSCTGQFAMRLNSSAWPMRIHAVLFWTQSLSLC